MTFSELEQKKYEKTIRAFIAKKRPPAHLRHRVDLSYRIEGQSVEIFEIRPMWSNPNEKIEEAVAKATYVKTQKIWKVFLAEGGSKVASVRA